jgi:adenosylhomocysteine nucleosidase
MIGIIGAMAVEIDELREKLCDPTDQVISNIRFTRGKLAGKDVVLAVCGIGKVFAAICAQTMILTYRPELIINTGVAGGLDEDLKIGDVVVATKLVQHDMDTTPLGDPPGLISGINVVEFPADESAAQLMRECVSEQGVGCRLGLIASGDQFVAGGEKKDFIKSTFHASACEMEGASIAHTAYVNGVPFAVIRAISDGANDDSHMDYPTFVKIAAHRSALAVEAFVSKR